MLVINNNMVLGNGYVYPTGKKLEQPKFIESKLFVPPQAVQDQLEKMKNTPKLKNPTDALIKPVYDFSKPMSKIPIDLAFNIIDTESTITLSTSNVTFASSAKATTEFDFEKNVGILSLDTLLLMNSTNNTDPPVSWDFRPLEFGLAKRLQMMFGVAYVCSAYTSGNMKIDTISIKIEQVNDDLSTIDNIIDSTNVTLNQVALAGTGTNVSIVKVDIPLNFKLNPAKVYQLTINLNSTFGAGTSVAGILPICSTIKSNVTKPFFLSSAFIHYQPLMTNSFNILREQDTFDKVDYSGVNQKGEIP